MIDEYQKRINAHHKAVARAEHSLFQLAQLLSPGNWVFHVIASTEYRGIGDHGMRIDDPVYYAIVTNGDDNVTAKGKTVASAVALLVHYLLNGSVFPLTGNCGRFNLDHWERKIEEAEERVRRSLPSLDSCGECRRAWPCGCGNPSRVCGGCGNDKGECCCGKDGYTHPILGGGL